MNLKTKNELIINIKFVHLKLSKIAKLLEKIETIVDEEKTLE